MWTSAIASTIQHNDDLISALTLKDLVPKMFELTPDGEIIAYDETAQGCGNFVIPEDGASRGFTSIATFNLLSSENRRPELRDERHEALFFRGGYSFAASGQGLADGAGAPLYAVGYRTRIREGLPLSFEAEVVFQRDKDPMLIGVGQEEATRRAISGLASLRYDAPKFGPVTPYFSGGFGPVHVKTEIDNGFTPISDSKIELGYGARDGVAMPLPRGASVEAGYRLLGATNDAIKTHSAEIGLSFSF